MEDDRKLYERMATAPILRNGEETVRKHFSLSDEIANGELKGKLHEMMRIGQ